MVLLLKEMCTNKRQWLQSLPAEEPLITGFITLTGVHRLLDYIDIYTNLGYYPLNSSNLIIVTTALHDTQFCNFVCYGLPSSGMWRNIGWQLFTNVLGQPIGPILKDQVVQEDRSVTSFNAMLPNIPEKRRPQLHHGGNLKSRFVHNVCQIMAIRYYSVHGYT